MNPACPPTGHGVTCPAVRFQRVSFAYGAGRPFVLRNLDLDIAEGEMLLVAGPSGSGKSTLLRCVNGLIPHFSGGQFGGSVVVDGLSTRDHPPRELADRVGFVFQDPDAQFVVETVEDELAFAMENLRLPRPLMGRRMEEVLDALHLAQLRGRRISTLSGGERQRVAIAGVLTAQPRVLVLDEPTSQLDPQAAEELLSVLQRLVHDLALTVVLAEHRLERVAGYADRVCLFAELGRAPIVGPPGEVLAGAESAPPLVRLSRLFGWSPPPLTVRDARPRAAEVRRQLADLAPPARAPHPETGTPAVACRDLRFSYGRRPALRGVSLDAGPGEILAVMGRNGSGKTTLLRAIVGLTRPTHGSIRVGGQDTSRLPVEALARLAGYVPQNPGGLLYHETVREEVAFTASNFGLSSDRVAETLEALGIDDLAQRHPRDLSEGERLLVALASVLVVGPRVLLLDEPTRGLDYAAKDRLVGLLHRLRSRGATVLLASHDVELAAAAADRVLLLAEGRLAAGGTAAEILGHSAIFSPQVSKVLGPGPFLTVAEVAAALEAAS